MVPGWVPVAFILSALGTVTTHLLCDEALQEDEGTILETVVAWATYQTCGDIPAWFGLLLFTIFKVPMLLTGVLLLLPIISGLLANPVAGTIASVGFVVALVATFVILL